MTPPPRAHHEFRVVGSLVKVFPDEAPAPAATTEPLTVFAGETASFQVAWRPPTVRDLSDLPRLRFRVAAGGGARVATSAVGLIPVAVPAFEDSDEQFLRKTPGLYPDPLFPLAPDEAVSSVLAAWSSVWVDVVVDDPRDAGAREVTVEVLAEDGASLFAATVPLHVHAHRLPELDITVAQWVHTDSLADHYGVEPFGEPHWRLVEDLLPSLVAAGGNCVLTPLWTPPLDTEVGGRRTRTQLLDVRWRDGAWEFDLARFDRWVRLVLAAGITVLEMPPFFTQWGAERTPSIWASTPEGEREVFGWHVGATDPRYRGFLAALLPRLRAHLERRWPQVSTFWHVSDEPGHDKLDGYLAAREVVRDLLAGEVVVDALSDRSFLTSGAVDVPVVASDAVEPFLTAGDRIWVYHCNGQDQLVSNRFVAMPSGRTRAIGQQVFAGGAAGFLHWGFNFWNAQLSRGPVDPYRDASAGGAFPAGDPFLVYPGADGRPVESLRHRAFAAGMADHRALQLLRDRVGQDAAARMTGDGRPLRFTDVRPDPGHWTASRRRIDRAALG